MIAKLYALGWFGLAALAGVLFAAGTPGDISLTILGFALFTLVFGGLVGVLPWWVDRQYNWKYRSSELPTG